MKNLVQDLWAFHNACDVQEFLNMSSVPQEVRDLRIKLLKEEFEEYLRAEKDHDEIEVADALADLIYIAVWTARTYWIPLDRVWNEVQRSNMDKVDPGTWKVKKRDDWKVLKPEWWVWPQLEKAIKEGREVNNSDYKQWIKAA